MATSAPARTPVHLWIVGIVSLLWNLVGAYDYVMTQTGNADYLSNFTEAQRAYFEAFPAWMEAASWALGVWGALLGSLLLLIRSRFAVWSFGISLLGLLISTIYQFGLSDLPADLTTPMMIGMTIAIWAIAIALFVYAHRMQARGVLR